MARLWRKDLVWTQAVLEVQDPWCAKCGRMMHKCDHRHHRIYTLAGPRHLVCKLVHCPDPICATFYRTFSPEQEANLTIPRWVIG